MGNFFKKAIYERQNSEDKILFHPKTKTKVYFCILYKLSKIFKKLGEIMPKNHVIFDRHES